jgi:uncharacterized protein DUF3291
MFASATRLRVRSFRNLPAFLWMTFLAQRQIKRAPGFLGGRLLIDNLRTYWTLSVWESEKAMKAFRSSGPHARVMPKLAEWCDEAAYTHWTAADDSIPEWLEAYDHLVSDGRLSRVARPSRDHVSRHFPKPRLQPMIGLSLKAVVVSKKSAA